MERFVTLTPTRPPAASGPLEPPLSRRARGMQHAAGKLIAALRAGDAPAAATAAAALPRARPAAGLSPRDVADITAHLAPARARAAPALAAAAAAALDGLAAAAEAGLAPVAAKLRSPAALNAACDLLGQITTEIAASEGSDDDRAAGGAGGAPGAPLAAPRAALLRLLRFAACRPPLLPSDLQMLQERAVREVLGPITQGRGMALATVSGLDFFASMGAVESLGCIKVLPATDAAAGAGGGAPEAPPRRAGRRWRFGGDEFDGGDVNGAARTVDVLLLPPGGGGGGPGVAEAAARALADGAAGPGVHSEAALLLAGLANAGGAAEARQELLRQMRAAPAGAVAEGLARWVGERRAGGGGEGAFGDVARAVARLLAKASPEGAAAVAALPELAAWAAPPPAGAAAGAAAAPRASGSAGGGARRGGAGACAACGKAGGEGGAALRRCSGCLQAAHWRARHKGECSRAAGARRGVA
ncbi:MAG: hypothetical protein J3K34DRAFT_483859 [Monoraphidium minutum]|nr:MAG: hypothetical protein J3K34DRAFT_483859 [Monoraphidium minutum]